MVDEGKVSTLQEMLTEEFTNTVCSPLRKVMLGASSQREKTAHIVNQTIADIQYRSTYIHYMLYLEYHTYCTH